MSDDWVRQYIDNTHKQRQQEKQDARTRRTFAEAGAPEKFHQIGERIRRDIQTLRGVVAFQAMEMRATDLSRNFQVFHLSPRAMLDVELDRVLIRYKYAFFPKEDSETGRADQMMGSLRICSDLNGLLTVYKNGSGEKFADDAEVSEFFLKPLLDYVDE